MGKKKKMRQPEPEQRQPRLNRRQLLGLAAAAALALCLLAWAATRPSAVMKKIDLLAREAQADWVDLELGMDPAGPAGYAVFFSVCSGESRASVYHSTGRTLAAAWDAAAVLILLFFATAVEHLGRGETAENRRQLEQALRQGCLACYAAEGVYPPDLAYLQEHYGLQVDETRYTVRYSAFAENLMPDITILENAP